MVLTQKKPFSAARTKAKPMKRENTASMQKNFANMRQLRSALEILDGKIRIYRNDAVKLSALKEQKSRMLQALGRMEGKTR